MDEGLFVPHLIKVASLAKIHQDGVRSEHFTDTAVGGMVGYALTYWTQANFQQAPTRALLEDHFAQWFSKRGWPPEDEDVIIEELCRLQLERFRRGRVQEVLMDIATKVMDDPGAALSELVSRSIALQIGTAEASRVVVYGQSFAARLDEYHDRVIESGRPGIYLGWPQLNDETYGIMLGEFAVLAGAPGVGKSWAMCKCALSAALGEHRVYFASLENNARMTLARCDCVITGTPWREYERGRLDLDQVNALKEARKLVESLGDRLVVDSPRRRDERTIAELYARARHHGAQLFVGDQLSHVNPGPEGRDLGPKETIDLILEQISDLSKEYNIASIWAVQRNREGAKAARAESWHAAGSSGIEAIVDLMMTIRRTRDMERDGKMELVITKNRRGRNSKWVMDWRLSGATRLEIEREMMIDG